MAQEEERERGIQDDPGEGADSTVAREWLEERWGTEPAPECPYCKNRRWGVIPAEPLFDVPMYRVRCEECGNTILIDSRAIPE